MTKLNCVRRIGDFNWCLCLLGGAALYVLESSQAIAQSAPTIPMLDQPNPMTQVTSVSQFSDVQPTDWAFGALQALVERYGCIIGYPDRTYRGNRALTRYEFAAGVDACLNRLSELLAASTVNLITKDDLLTLQKLQEEFAAELATLRGRVDALEIRTATVERSQFSTTTRLTGQVIIAANEGSFGGARIIAPRGAVITASDPNATVLYRTSFNLNTSFQGNDLLQVRLVTGSDRATDNTAGFLEPNLGSVLDYSLPGTDGQISLGRAYYTFTPVKDLNVTIGSLLSALEFVDKNRYANTSFRDFSTQALVNNFILAPRPVGAGAVLAWNPGKGAFKLRAVYVAASAAAALGENQRLTGGGGPEDVRLFPISGGGAAGGLFGDPYQGIIELEYAPINWFTARLLYSGGRLFGSDFDVFGANIELALSDRLGLFGRYGSASYPNTTLGDIKPKYWSTGVVLQDLFVRGALAGFGVGQPFIEAAAGNATQTNLEAFYNVPINDRIQVTPLIQVITKAGNRNENGTIITGTLRAVFSF